MAEVEDFFKKVFDELEGNKKILTAVLTNIDSEEISQNLLGEMFLFDEDGIIDFSSEQLENELEQFLLNQDFKKEILELRENKNLDSQLKSIHLDQDNRLEIFLEPVVDQPHLTVFGAGHIAEPLVKICSLLDFTITVVDDREEFLNYDKFPTADQLLLLDYEDYFADAKIKENDYLVIVTRGHQHDYQVLKNVINSEAAYLGMIGSSRKIETVYNQLRDDGIKESKLEAVHAPIGLDIGSETPAEIAVAIAAEIIAVRRDK
ncbi:xanthine dehydrogenase accessory factor [Halanaerobium saccharolyticum]|uniref:Xanthine dehydrogenase accessory factor n=1 Tax=Halanaerobium saccharolyticum TaxID=43595 RepID=A0A4V3G630_9FIRM|nr:XdhC family protein [Halanaerobium saccharolyticum]RAK11848.1 xanthine dehydrogenase accessory factor [Halanaerobium saccharolyticum]TDW07689.1 xanthine dehydrogenase accessory factor [Halanaerobium saccharolyticum]TDX64610.1 xanthine dehydrogenase accessory factor [Halanaerobium saccharolyticum]